jgi:hypothetical protein
MIQGRFGENGQIYFEIDLITGDGLSFSTEAMLDKCINLTVVLLK